MRERAVGKTLFIVGVSVAVIAALVWTIVRDRRSEPYSAPRASLSGWTVIAGQGSDPWTLGLQPPAALVDSLMRQIKEKTGAALVAPERAAMPLVLRGEYEDALQGVYGVDTLTRFAREGGIDRAEFQPVCIAHHRARNQDLFFVAFSSDAFYQLREDFMPPQPEHGGVGVYDPASATPLLPIASTTADISSFFPLAFDAAVDCEAQLYVQ